MNDSEVMAATLELLDKCKDSYQYSLVLGCVYGAMVRVHGLDACEAALGGSREVVRQALSNGEPTAN